MFYISMLSFKFGKFCTRLQYGGLLCEERFPSLTQGTLVMIVFFLLVKRKIRSNCKLGRSPDIIAAYFMVSSYYYYFFKKPFW